MSWKLSLAMAIAAACCCDRAVTARIDIAEYNGLNATRFIGAFIVKAQAAFSNLVQDTLGGVKGGNTNIAVAEALGNSADVAPTADVVATAMESATPAMEEAVAEAAKSGVENGLQEVFSDPSTYELLGEHGATAAIDALTTNPGVQTMVTDTTANAVTTGLDTFASSEVGQFALWAVGGAAMLSVMELGVSVMILWEIKKGFEKVEKAIQHLEATVEKGLSRIYNKLDEIKDVLQLQFLNDATAQIEMSWDSMGYCVKHAATCESTPDFDGLATVEKRQKIAMGLQQLDAAIRGQTNAMKLTKIDLMVRIVNLALQNTPQLNHQQVRAAAWNYWGELMILQVKGSAVLEYMGRSEALRSELWGNDRLQNDLNSRLDMQRVRIKEIFDSMEVEGYYLRSKSAQTCLLPGWALGTLQYEGDCAVPDQQKMIFNVVPMQAVHLPVKPGQTAESLDHLAYQKKSHQFFVRHKVSKKCLTINAMSKIKVGSLELTDNLTNVERDADVDKHLFHVSPADLEGSFYLDFVDPSDGGELKCVRPDWYHPSKLTGFKSHFANRLKIGHKPCQSKQNPYPRLAFEMLFSVQEVPAKAAMTLPWSSVRPRDNDKELQKALADGDDNSDEDAE